MTELLPVLGAALVTGLLGSAHCFGMCAGISGLFAVNANDETAASEARPTRPRVNRTTFFPSAGMCPV